MTLLLKVDLDIVKMYLCTENEIPSFSGSKVTSRTERNTDTQKKLLPIRIRGWLHGMTNLLQESGNISERKLGEPWEYLCFLR